MNGCCGLPGGIRWLVQVGLIAVFSMGVGVRAQPVSFLVQDTLVDSTVAMAPGTFAMIYLDNQLVAQSADTLFLHWQIDTVFGTIDSLLAGFCTEICYPTTVTSGTEIVAPGGTLPLKGYFMPAGAGFVDTGWAVLRVRLWDSLNPQSAVVVTYFLRLRWEGVTGNREASAGNGWAQVGATHTCLAFWGGAMGSGERIWRVVNRCPYPVRFHVVHISGEHIQWGTISPYGQAMLRGVRDLSWVPAYFYLLEDPQSLPPQSTR